MCRGRAVKHTGSNFSASDRQSVGLSEISEVCRGRVVKHTGLKLWFFWLAECGSSPSMTAQFIRVDLAISQSQETFDVTYHSSVNDQGGHTSQFIRVDSAISKG